MIPVVRSVALWLSFLTGPAPEQDVDISTLPVEGVRAFPSLTFRRPIILTHSGDGTNRVFVASQLGTIHVFPNDPSARQAKIFLDLEPKVIFQQHMNEEGFLGLSFHPKYEENGEFFVYYTTRERPHTSVISRFRVSAEDPDRADLSSEEELLRIRQPFWNHNGGTVEFGPDGYLYIALGDGGAANDPRGNGQNLSTLFGTILRIDVDHKDPGKNYAIPADNPFMGRARARGEIWAYGLRNVWRFSFDRETGTCWAGDVGQDTWEEIDIIVRGGNYGWNLREGMHKFGRRGSEPRDNLIGPIWEYHHNVGKSITGGNVYRGKRVPELAGLYLYADYVSGDLWALNYDPVAKRVIANHSIRRAVNPPVISFGEDEAGEVYYTSDNGMIFTFQRVLE